MLSFHCVFSLVNSKIPKKLVLDQSKHLLGFLLSACQIVQVQNRYGKAEASMNLNNMPYFNGNCPATISGSFMHHSIFSVIGHGSMIYSRVYMD